MYKIPDIFSIFFYRDTLEMFRVCFILISDIAYFIGLSLVSLSDEIQSRLQELQRQYLLLTELQAQQL